MRPGNPDHWIHVVASPRWIRVFFSGSVIADSKRVLLLREAGCLPVYYFPMEDVRTDLMVRTDHKSHSPYKGEATYWTIRVGERVAERASWSYQEPPPECAGLKSHMAFEWAKMDAWYEEEDEIFVHPRDPYKRVDVLQSSRHVRVMVGGEALGDTRRPRLLFETGHPVRYYIPTEDVRMDLLEPTVTASRCPYKGIASYWSATIGDRVFPDIAWSYLDTIPECPKIGGLICFFQERGAAIWLDGEQIPVPKTRWSR